MSIAASPPAPGELNPGAIRTSALSRQAVLWALAGITVAGAILRFATLGLQSFHHDELVTVSRIIGGSFRHMLHEVKVSESNPPLYYSLAWVWAHFFGLGETGMRSLSALFGTAVIPVSYLIGHQLTSRRGGLILAGLVAFNPMLIWYSQEARSYIVMVFFVAVSMFFFLRALESRRGLDLALWAAASALAICSHYFAFFFVAIEAGWLAVALRSRWRALLPAFGLLLLVSLALLPLIKAQTNTTHIGWINNRPLPERLVNAGASDMIGETGSVIGRVPDNGLAVVPGILFAIGALIALTCGSRRERRHFVLALTLGLGVVALACLAAATGKDYVIDRNLLPSLVPLLAVAAIGFSAERTRWLGGLLAAALCVYWLAFDIHVTRTPSLQRPETGHLAAKLGPPHGRRAIVTWTLSAVGLKWYLGEDMKGLHKGKVRVHEVDIITKPQFAHKPLALPPGLHLAGRRRLDQFTISRYVSSHPVRVHFKQLHAAETGFGHTEVLLDGRKYHSHHGTAATRHERRRRHRRHLRHERRLRRARRLRHARSAG